MTDAGTANRIQPVTGNPTQISSVYSSDYQVINVGTATVYLGQNSSLSLNAYGVPLAPGASMQWHGTSELWGLCNPADLAANLTGSVSILYSGASLFTPGPSTVSSKLNASVLASYSSTITAGSTQQILDTGLGGLNTFQTLFLGVGALSLNLPGINTTRVTVRWYDSTGTVVISTDVCDFFTGGTLQWVLPIKSSRAIVSLTPNAGADFTGAFLIEAVSVLLPRKYFQGPPLPRANVGTATIVEFDAVLQGSYFITYNAGTLQTNGIPSRAGPGMFTYSDLSAGPTQMDIQIMGPSGLEGHVARFTQAANSTSSPIPILLPERPIRLVQTQVGPGELSLQYGV